MDSREGNYTHEKFSGLEYSLDPNNHHHQQEELMSTHTIGATSSDHNNNNNNQMVDYMLQNPSSPSPLGSNSFEKLSFADVMQFADFGPKLALNQSKPSKDETPNIDPVYFLKFPVLNDHQQKLQENGANHHHSFQIQEMGDKAEDNNSVQLKFLSETLEKNPGTESAKTKRKRPRSVKTNEEVESQRMTHIAVERNRRKQMNEHLRVLRSLMPSSYVQRGDQASIIGGAIEFVRELEQLLQCLESQKRRRLYGDGQTRPATDPSLPGQKQTQQQQPVMFPPAGPEDQPGNLVDFDQQQQMGLREDAAESKSCIADVEVKLLGFDALIKILSRRRPGQLIKTVDALEDLQLNILHTNITTIEQTVLYSFNVKMCGEARFTAEDIANSVQQLFSFIHADSGI